MANFSKSNVPRFSVDVYQNEYLPEGGREVNAIVTVTSTGAARPVECHWQEPRPRPPPFPGTARTRPW